MWATHATQVWGPLEESGCAHPPWAHSEWAGKNSRARAALWASGDERAFELLFNWTRLTKLLLGSLRALPPRKDAASRALHNNFSKARTSVGSGSGSSLGRCLRRNANVGKWPVSVLHSPFPFTTLSSLMTQASSSSCQMPYSPGISMGFSS